MRRSRLSPQKGDAQLRMPSPLGPNRPRPSSGLSIRSEESTSQRAAISTATVNKPSKPASGMSKSNGSAISAPKSQRPAAARKRTLEETADDSGRPRKSTKLDTDRDAPRSDETATLNGGVAKGGGGVAKNSDVPLKRKANDISFGIHDNDLEPAPKHRRTESSSTNSATTSSQSVSSVSQSTTARTSVASPSIGRNSPAAWQRSPSGSAASSSSEAMKLSWERALEEAERFRTQYYPAYSEMYDQLMAKPKDTVTMDERRKLREMHERLKQMKREISLAAE